MKGCLTIFCHEIFAQGDVHIFSRKNSMEAILNFLLKMLSGETVQILPNFPAKSLSIYLNRFFLTPLLVI